jgi:hypothetical protein
VNVYDLVSLLLLGGVVLALSWVVAAVETIDALR